MAVRETADAAKERFGKGDLGALFEGASKVVVAKGKKVSTFDLATVPPSSAAFSEVVLGPTGNLRAPAVRIGKTWYVGFDEDAWGERFR